jgi:hypothetical protein
MVMPVDCGVNMKTIRKPKIGLVGVMATPWRGDKETQYRQSRGKVEKMAAHLGFEFKAYEQGIYDETTAQLAADSLAAWGADFIIIQFSSFASGYFLYPFAKLPARLGLWAVPEGEPTAKGGLPLNSFTGLNLYNSLLKVYLKDYQKPVKWFFGAPGHQLFDDRLAVTVRALTAVVNLKGANVGLVGSVAPSFDNLIIDDRQLRKQLGINVVHVEFDEVLQKAKAYTDAARLETVTQAIQSGADTLDLPKLEELEKTARLQMAFEDMVRERNLDALAISCWPRFQSEYDLAICTLMGQLNESGIVAACEGDIPSAVSMLALHLMAQGDVVTLMDLVTVDDSDDSILFWHCGPTAPSLSDGSGVRMEPLYLFDGPQGEQTGMHNDLVLKPGKATVMGFTPDFDGMLVLDGEFDNQKPSYGGSRGWFRNMHINGTPSSVPELIETIMVSGYQHHYPVAYGNLAEASLELAAWLNLKLIQKQAYTPYLK